MVHVALTTQVARQGKEPTPDGRGCSVARRGVSDADLLGPGAAAGGVLAAKGGPLGPDPGLVDGPGAAVGRPGAPGGPRGAAVLAAMASYMRRNRGKKARRAPQSAPRRGQPGLFAEDSACSWSHRTTTEGSNRGGGACATGQRGAPLHLAAGGDRAAAISGRASPPTGPGLRSDILTPARVPVSGRMDNGA